jgi:hypothetical protein
MTPEQMEELSVFNAVGGLGLAAVGGIGVFVIGATATLGVASAAAAVLGAPVSLLFLSWKKETKKNFADGDKKPFSFLPSPPPPLSV